MRRASPATQPLAAPLATSPPRDSGTCGSSPGVCVHTLCSDNAVGLKVSSSHDHVVCCLGLRVWEASELCCGCRRICGTQAHAAVRLAACHAAEHVAAWSVLPGVGQHVL
eukprot:365163-Chlamydomonas_euryale.AAC.4